MRKIISSLAGLALIAALGSTGFADNKKGGGDKGGDNGGTARVKTYDFSGDTIEGDLIKPEGSTVDARDFAKHGSLINIRKDFIPEIIKSAEDLP
jgi:hypothetical protein